MTRDQVKAADQAHTDALQTDPPLIANILDTYLQSAGRALLRVRYVHDNGPRYLAWPVRVPAGVDHQEQANSLKGLVMRRLRQREYRRASERVIIDDVDPTNVNLRVLTQEQFEERLFRDYLNAQSSDFESRDRWEYLLLVNGHLDQYTDAYIASYFPRWTEAEVRDARARTRTLTISQAELDHGKGVEEQPDPTVSEIPL